MLDIKNKKVLYLCKNFQNINDGGKIYDFKLSNALKNTINLEVYFVNIIRPFGLPFWKGKIENEELNYIKKKSKSYDYIIISHEGLGSLVPILKPDLFIFHNVFSIFDSPNRFLNFYYRLGAGKFEKFIVTNSKNVLTLSFREQKHLNKKFSKVILCEPPGLRTIDICDYKDFSKIKLTGSYDWLPKKLSRLTKKELSHLEKNFEIIEEDNEETNVSLIEENFLAGFKLKLMQMLYRGDYIFSRVDLKEEIESLGLRSDLFFYIKNINEINQILALNKKDYLDIVDHNRSLLKIKYKWSNIAERIQKEFTSF
jgi:hypothetical protein